MTPPEAEDAAPPPPPPPPAPAPALAYNPTVSGAPVYYNLPQPSGPTERPAKKQKTKEPSKPERMMATMGYVKGQGLGKNSDGITTALEVKARKDQVSRQMRDEFESDGKTIKSQQVFDIKVGDATPADQRFMDLMAPYSGRHVRWN